MRKCHLCGSLIRRRAEFCRYCTVRQPGAPLTDAAGGPGAPPPGATHDGANRRPPRASVGVPLDTATLEQAMQPQAGATTVDAEAPDEIQIAPLPRHEPDAPSTYEIDPPPGAADVELPPDLRPTNGAAGETVTAANPGPPNGAHTASRHGDDHASRHDDHDDHDDHDTASHHDERVTTSDTDRRPAPPRATRRNGHRHKPARADRAPDGAAPRNGTGAHRADTDPPEEPVEVATPADVADATATNRASTTDAKPTNGRRERPRPNDLRGFEHFPEATAAPKVRWG